MPPLHRWRWYSWADADTEVGCTCPSCIPAWFGREGWGAQGRCGGWGWCSLVNVRGHARGGGWHSLHRGGHTGGQGRALSLLCPQKGGVGGCVPPLWGTTRGCARILQIARASLLRHPACVLHLDFTTIRRHVGLHRFLHLFPPHRSPLYDTISSCFQCTIQSRLAFVVQYDLTAFLYNMILRLYPVRYQSRSHRYYDT